MLLLATASEPVVVSPVEPEYRLRLRSDNAAETGGTLTSWGDISGNSEPVTVSVAPTVVAAQLNGYQVVRFAGAEYLAVDGLASIFNGDNKPFSIFVVAKVSSLAADRAVFSAGQASSGVPFVRARSRTSVNTWAMSRRGDDSVFTQLSATTNSVDTETWGLLEFVFDGALSDLYISGRRITTGSTNLVAGSMTIDRVTIGCSRGSANLEFFQGDLAEIMVLDYAATTENRLWVEQYVRDRYDMNVDHSYFVSTATGSDTNSGMTPNSPLLTVNHAFGRLGSIGGTIYLEASESAPIREEFELNISRRIVLDATDPTNPWHWYATEAYTAGWVSEGGGVYSQAVDSDPVAPLFVTTQTVNGFHPVMWNDGDTTTPAAGRYGYSAGVVYLRMAADENPNDHTIEISRLNAPIRVANNRSATLTVKNGVVRGGRTGAIVPTKPDLGGVVILEDMLLQFGNNNLAIQPAGGLAAAIAKRVVSQWAHNDGFNLHNDDLDPSYMRLEDCEASYNRDEGASPHDDTIMEIVGGHYHNNGSAGVTAIQNAILRIDGALFSENGQGSPTVREGGIYFADNATGYIRDVTVSGNLGPGVYVNSVGRVLVERLTSTDNLLDDTY